MDSAHGVDSAAYFFGTIKDVAVENSAVLVGSAWAMRIPAGVKPSLL
jgi:hypothetical protein